MNTRTKIRISLVIVLFSGTVIGFFAGQMHLRWRMAVMARRGPSALQEVMFRRIQMRLRLEPGQIPAVEEAMGRVARNLEEHRRRQQTQQWVLIRDALYEMQPGLTPEQRAVLDRMSLADLLPGPTPRSDP